MPTTFDREKCRARNRVAARRDGVNAAPVRFHAATNLAAIAPADGARTRGYLPTTPAGALVRINASLPEGAPPLTESDVYIHYAEAANDNYVACYYLFLDASTLLNVARDAEAGFAFMNSHRTGGLSHPSELPFGRTFGGQYQEWEEGGQTRRRAVLGVYMLRGLQPNGANGPSTDDLHRMISGGQTFDVSVGLRGGTPVCDVCGNDVRDYEACPHVPGTHRKMGEPQKAAQRARGVADGKATYTLADARCGEISAVYDGAVPGAGFTKALSLARRGTLTPDVAVEARAAYAALLSRSDAALLSKGGGMDPYDIVDAIKDGFDGLRQQLRRDRDEPAGITRMEDIRMENIAPAVVELAPHPVLAACLAAGITTVEQLSDLQARAVLGDARVAELREDAKKEAVRAFGQEAAAPHIAALANAGHAELQRNRDLFRALADAKFGTQADKPAERATVPPALSVTALPVDEKHLTAFEAALERAADRAAEDVKARAAR